MSCVTASEMIGAPQVISSVMPGVVSHFMELGQGVMAAVYAGDGDRHSQAAMTNDSSYVYFSTLLAGRVETRTGQFLLEPSVGSGHIGYLPTDKFEVKASANFRQVELMVPPDTLMELAGDDADWLYHDVAHGPFFYDSAPGQQALEAAVTLYERMQPGQTSALMVKAAALELLAWRLGNPKSSSKVNRADTAVPLRERKQLLVARELLLHDLSAPPTIAELALATGLNQLKLKRGFRHLFGTSIYALFLRERMNRARQLLRHHNVGDTAQLLGYRNTSHFSKVYHNQFGVLPSQARRDGV